MAQWESGLVSGAWAAAAGDGTSRTLAHAAAISPVTPFPTLTFFLISSEGRALNQPHQ
ncbi:hypothetical protein GCM10010387_18180 [Streptomyces inusitatus]|uniref:Uncharacterized protein n=1 Tax=Streptomyces inusitatus TaxID=68221 RepID=A0A918PVX5_9ACTN|nr:hypothetical protein GCM10010387_18180 [Streptomyces inusitatus]